MKLRRFLALLAALALVLTLVACEKGGIPEPDYDNLPDDYEEEIEPTGSETASESAPASEGNDPAPASEPTPASEGNAPAPAATGKSEAICALAESLIGTTFRYGAVGPTEFDNSGFVYYCCKQNGVDLPRKTVDMASFGTAVSKSDVKRGDVLIFSNTVGGEAEFVGIYAGEGSFIACNNENSPTKKQSFTCDYWQERFITARRVG